MRACDVRGIAVLTLTQQSLFRIDSRALAAEVHRDAASRGRWQRGS